MAGSCPAGPGRNRLWGTSIPPLGVLAMAAEIERKFLPSRPPDGLRERPAVRIEQGYLAIGEAVEVRLRRAGEGRLLTVKRGRGEVREEVEVAIGAEEFERLWPLTGSRRLVKTRYRVPLNGRLEAEVDVFEGGLAGLLVAEVEFGSERESSAFEPRSWLGVEVTGDDRYASQTLAVDGLPVARPKRPYGLKRKEGAADGVRRIALGRAEKALEELGEAGQGDAAAAVHGARKDLKKLRAVLRLVRGSLDKETFATENRRYRDAGRLLGASRDAEVKLQTLTALEQRFGADFPLGPAGSWRRVLDRDRERLGGSARGQTARRIERAGAAIEEGRARIPRWSLREDSWKLIGPGLVRSYRLGRRALKRTRADPSAENVHEWRKRAKDAWYQLRLLRKAWPGPLGEMADQAHDLTDLLGEHHDLAVLAEDLGDRHEVERREAFAALIERRQEELVGEAVALGRRLYAEKPKALGRRLEACWEAWREE
jgi:CYTH domain-containing protein/CHAD domain-containing protein